MARQLCGTKIELDLRPVTLPHSHRGNTHTRLYTHTHSLSLSLSFSCILVHTLIFDISQLQKGGRRQARFVSPFGVAAQQFSPRCHFIHFYSLLFRIYQHFFRCHQSPASSRLHCQPSRLRMSHSLPLCLLGRLEMRFENLQTQMKMENGTCSTLYIECVLCF